MQIEPIKRNYFIHPGVTFQHVNMNDYIINQVCNFFEITPEVLKSKTRKREIIWPPPNLPSIIAGVFG